MKNPGLSFAHHVFVLAERRPALPWLLAFGLVVFVAGFAPIRYLISDDIGILRNLEQGFEVSFIAMLLGKGLGVLYRALPYRVPWYGLMLYLAHAISLGLFLSAVVHLKTLRRTAWLLVPLYLAVYAGFLLRVSFNSASVMIGFNAWLAWLVRADRNPGPGFAGILGFSAALVASYLIRVDGFRMVLLLAAPLGLAGVWRTRRRWPAHLLFLAPVAAVIALNALVLRQGVSRGYREYSDFNRARGRFMDSPLSVANTNNLALMALNGWTANDYDLLTRWFFINEEVYAKEHLQALLAHPDVARAVPDAHLAHTVGTFIRKYGTYLWVLLLALAGPVLLGSGRTGRLPVYYLLYTLAVLLGIALVYQLPPRIGWPALLAAAGGMLFLHSLSPPPPDSAIASGPGLAWPGRVWQAAVLLTLSGWVMAAGVTCVKGQAARRVLDESIAVLRSYPPETLFITEPSQAILWEDMSPLQLRRSLPENVLPSGWATFSPLFYAVLRRHGFAAGRDLLPAAVDNPRVLFILRHVEFGGLITAFLDDHAGLAVRMERIGPLAGNAAVYRLVGVREAGRKE